MLDTKYNHEEVEKGKYSFWQSKGYFKSGDKTKKPYCIVLPPPNVTGVLHLGHAWDVTLQGREMTIKQALKKQIEFSL